MSFALEISAGSEWEIVPGRGYETLDVSGAFPAYKRAFYVRLPPGASMHKHVDAGDCNTDHVVVTTNPQCLNWWTDETGDHSIHMQAGARYRVERTLVHWAENNGDTDRIHLLLEY